MCILTRHMICKIFEAVLLNSHSHGLREDFIVNYYFLVPLRIFVYAIISFSFWLKIFCKSDMEKSADFDYYCQNRLQWNSETSANLCILLHQTFICRNENEKQFSLNRHHSKSKHMIILITIWFYPFLLYFLYIFVYI